MKSKMQRILIVFLVCAGLLNICMSESILGIFPTPCISHQQVYQRLMEELVRNGHEVVILTTDGAIYNEVPKLTIIDAHNVSYDKFQSKYNFDTSQKLSIRDLMMAVRSVLTEIIHAQLSMPQMEAILNDKTAHFDLVIVESLHPVLAALSSRFNSPLIGISSLSGLISNFDALGSPSHPLIYPELFSKYIGEQSFRQKIETLYTYLFRKYYVQLYMTPDMEWISRKYFGPNLPTIAEAEEQMSMMFLNVNPVFGHMRPVVPAVVNLGGLHLKPGKHLPQNLQEFLDSSERGVVYFSFGSSIHSNALPWSKVEIFLNVFRELPFDIVWKWENDTLPWKPRNVYISKWLPQQDLLGHPKVKVFITQCGQQSLDESIHHAVPVLGIPFVGDQFFNVKLVVKFGIGRGYDFSLLDEISFKLALLDVLEDSRYHTNVKRLSALLRDQQQTPLERAVWWTEYVLRHRGAIHLHPPAIPLYEYFMIDVIAFIILIILFIIWLFYATIKYLSSLLKKLFKVRSN